MSEGKRMNKGERMIKPCKWLYVFLMLLTIAGSSYAQEDSNTRQDAVLDTVVSPPAKENSEDTAQNFFNPKAIANQPYSNSKIESRVSADTQVNALKNDDAFWYVNSIEKFKAATEKVRYDKATRDSLARKKAATDTYPFFDERYNFNIPEWVNTLMWAIIIAIFLFAVVYFLLANKINIFSRSSKHALDADAQVDEVDLFKIPYHDLLQKAYAEKNYRLAVRILYLQTLKLLSEKNIILFQADYTNMDYLQQLSQTHFYKDFFTITRHYEYVWYGGFAVSEPAFATIRNDFNTIQHTILQQ